MEGEPREWYRVLGEGGKGEGGWGVPGVLPVIATLKDAHARSGTPVL